MPKKLVLTLALLLYAATAIAEKTIIYQTNYGVKDLSRPATVIEETKSPY